MELAEEMLSSGPQAVRCALKVIRAGRNLSLAGALDLEKRTAIDLIASGECLYGIGAFLSGERVDFPDPEPENTDP